MFLFRKKDPEVMNEEQRSIFLFVGLGNPGREYRLSRHNVGFMVIDQLAKWLGIRIARVQFKALVTSGSVDNLKVVLSKPQTYMNLSGQAVRSLVKFYKVPLSQVMVIHDDMDLPFGILRIRPAGGSAGQKGMASIIECLGSESFPRMRIGIDHPPGQMDAADYVLQEFSSSEKKVLDEVLGQSVQAVRTFMIDGLDKAMNLFNGPVLKE